MIERRVVWYPHLFFSLSVVRFLQAVVSLLLCFIGLDVLWVHVVAINLWH